MRQGRAQIDIVETTRTTANYGRSLMAWIELGVSCTACNTQFLVLLEAVERHPVCPRCCKDITAVEVFRLSGFVYLLSNPSMPGLLKIGYTERDVTERAAEISAATGVPEPYLDRIGKCIFPIAEAPVSQG
jgi:hypothetical protein